MVRLARFSLRRSRLVMAVLLGVVAICAILGLPPKVNGDLLALLPAHDPAVMAVHAFRATPDGGGTVLITMPEGTDLDAVVQRISGLDTVRSAYATVHEPLRTRLGLLQLDPKDTHALASRLSAALLVPNPLIQAQLLAGIKVPEPPRLSVIPPDTVVVIPAGSALDANFSLKLYEQIREAVPNALWLGGPPIVVAQSIGWVRDDIVSTSVFSLLLVLGVMVVSFRDLRVLFVIFVPLLLAVIVSLGLDQLILGSLNTYTAMGSAVLTGLGDFGVHLVVRYREVRASGLGVEESIERTWGEIGPPCATACWTSAAAFLTLLFADFRGISQLGLVLALGLVLTLVYSMMMQPILLRWLDPVPKGGARAVKPIPTPRRWGSVLAFTMLVTLVLGWSSRDLHIEYDITSLRPEGQSFGELSEAQRGWLQQAFPPIVIDVSDRAAEHKRLAALVAEGRLPHVRAVLSLDSVLPPDQEARLVGIRELVTVANDPRAANLPEQVRVALAPLIGLDTSPVTAAELPPAMVSLLGGADTPRVLLLLQGNMLDLRESHALSEEIEGLIDRKAASNEFLAHASMYMLITHDLPIIAMAALFAVIVLTTIDLRRPRLVILAFCGLFIGLIWSGGVMAITGTNLNLVNVLALPILLGIGVDVVIHMLHRMESEGDVGIALATTGKAALISMLTTLVGFLALVFASSRGVRSLGQIVALGLAATFVSAVTTVPALWKMLGGGRIKEH